MIHFKLACKGVRCSCHLDVEQAFERSLAAIPAHTALFCIVFATHCTVLQSSSSFGLPHPCQFGRELVTVSPLAPTLVPDLFSARSKSLPSKLRLAANFSFFSFLDYRIAAPPAVPHHSHWTVFIFLMKYTTYQNLLKDDTTTLLGSNLRCPVAYFR